MDCQNSVKYIYRFGLFCFFFSVLMFASGWMARDTAYAINIISFILFPIGLLIELSPIVFHAFQKMFEVKNPVLKWLLRIFVSGLTLTLLIVSNIQAGNLINILTRENPNNFLAARGFLSVISGLGLLLITFTCCVLFSTTAYAVSLNGATILATFGGPDTWIKRNKLDFAFGRMFGAATLACLSFFVAIKVYTSYDYAPYLLVATEYKAASSCINQQFNERIAFIEDDYISVAIPTKDGSYSFETRKCLRKP